MRYDERLISPNPDDMKDSVAALRHYQSMQKEGLILSYCGTLTHDLMTTFLQLADAKLKDMQATKKKQKNIINVLIECLQNAMFHGDVEGGSTAFPDNYNSCLVALGHETGEFYIYAGNYLTGQSAAKLQQKLEHMLPMTSEQLHDLYLNQLSSGEMSPKGGAGLGIIRILRESNQQIAYAFREVTSDASFFSLQVKISV
jgi:hypothetical protein